MWKRVVPHSDLRPFSTMRLGITQLGGVNLGEDRRAFEEHPKTAEFN